MPRTFLEVTWKGKKVGAYSTLVKQGENYVYGYMLSTGETITEQELKDDNTRTKR